MESVMKYESGLNFEATELRLGLPGIDEAEKQKHKSNKRALDDISGDHDCGSKNNSSISDARDGDPKQQVVGWPPVRSYRKNSFQSRKNGSETKTGTYVKVSMDGAPYLRKIDLKVYNGYQELLKVLESMFMFKFTIGEYSEREGYNGSEFTPTYEDKDGDWMLVGDVPWEMFMSSCKRLRIMKGSEAKGLGWLYKPS